MGWESSFWTTVMVVMVLDCTPPLQEPLITGQETPTESRGNA